MSDSLVRALESTKGPHQEYAEELAIGIREALPPEAAFVTVDSLAAALPNWVNLEWWADHLCHGSKTPQQFAAAIIQAAKEASDLDGKPFCPTGYAQRYHAVGECDCEPVVYVGMAGQPMPDPAKEAERE